MSAIAAAASEDQKSVQQVHGASVSGTPSITLSTGAAGVAHRSSASGPTDPARLSVPPRTAAASDFGGQRSRELRQRWKAACEGIGLALWVETLSGWTVSIPVVEQIAYGEPTSITVHLRPGQIPSDIEAFAPRIAYAMGVESVTVAEGSEPGRVCVALHGVPVDWLPSQEKHPNEDLPLPSPE